MGLVPNSGTVRFDGRLLPRRNPVAVARQGVVLVPEGRGVFGPMTVAENLELGAYAIGGRGEVLEQRRGRGLGLFRRPRERLGQVAGSRSEAGQQMLAVGRALMSGPELLLVDELSLRVVHCGSVRNPATLGLLNREV